MTPELIITGLTSATIAVIATYITQKAKNRANTQDARQHSYEQKSGENAATKHDIEEITQKIETIKNQLSELSSKKYDRFMQFRNAIVELLDALTVMVEWKFKIVPMGEDLQNHEAIKSGYSNFIASWADLSFKLRKVQLYSDSADKQFMTQLFEHYTVFCKQHAVTVEYYDALIRNTGFNKNQDITAVKAVGAGVGNFITKRNAIEDQVIQAYLQIQNSLRQKLAEKYDL